MLKYSDIMNFEQATRNVETASTIHENFIGIKPVITEEELYDFAEEVPEIRPLVDSFFAYAERYAEDVWLIHTMLSEGSLDTEEGANEYAEMDNARTVLRNALVDSIAILSRALAKHGLDNEWVRELTDGVNLNRASCGVLAIMLVYKRYIDKQGKMS